MNRQIILPESKEHWLALRLKNINSSEVAALFDMSPYMTKFELWHRIKNAAAVDFDENVRVKWGNRLETAIAQGVAEDNSWVVQPMKNYICVPDLRIGSSFDFEIIGGEPTILEIKNVDALVLRDQWDINDDAPEAPSHIELQVQHQLLVSGYKFAYIAALVGGNRVVLIKREADDLIHNAIKDRAAEFWQSIDKNVPPTPDFAKDSEFIASLYRVAEPNKVLDARGDVVLADLASKYRLASQDANVAEAKKKAIKAQILTIAGDVEKIIGDTFSSITLNMVGPSTYTVNRDGYRMFKVNFPKVKNALPDD